MRRLIIWGAGQLGSTVARLWLQAGGPVVGLTQTTTRHAALQAMGAEPALGSPVGLLAPNDALLMSLPGHKTQREAIETLLRSNTPPPARTVLISTTGYYGTAPQGVINEESPQGQGERSASIAGTEQAFLNWAGSTGVILRLGGLYGLGRGPIYALARRGAPKILPPNKALALVHYTDVAAAVCAALQHASPETVYLCVTPPCPTREEFYRLACQKLELPEPVFADPLPHPPAGYDVSRLRRDLLPEPAYPSWRAALELL